MTRRSRRAVAAVAALAPVLGLAACGDTVTEVWADETAAASEPVPAEPFIYRDARGVTVTLEGKPVVVVAQSSVAAALWDAGYRVDGVYGELPATEDAAGYQTGSLDLAQVAVLGRTFGEFDLEQYRTMDPDLLVDLTMDQTSLWYVPSEQAEDVLALAPSIAVPGMGYADTDQAIAAMLELADELGADTDSARLQRDEAAYDRALDEVAALAEQKPDLQVLVVTRDPGQLYVADRAFFPELGSLADAGLELIEPEGASTGFHAVGWDQVAQYADADVILYDARELPDVAAQVDQLDAWTSLPAVRAGQVYPWHTGSPSSYRAYAEVYDKVAQWLSEAEPVG